MCRPEIAVALMALAVAAQAAAGTPAEQRIEAGRRIYQAQCAACHGARGEGQAGWERLNPAGELPAPPHDRTGHTWKHSDAMLHRVVSEGWRDPFNKTKRLTMPAFGQTLKTAEIRAVIDYLKTLWTPQQRAFQREESRKAPFPSSTERKPS